MALNQDDVIQILKYMAESSFNELRLEIGDLKIVVLKSGPTDSPQRVETERVESTLVDHAASQSGGGADLDAGGENPDSLAVLPETPLTGWETREAQPSSGEEIDEGVLVPIRAPMLGTFYQAPSPGEPPFVEVGMMVDEDTTVCIIEVMKLFTTIKAGLRGRITRIRANDGQLVEYNQVLFLIDPPALVDPKLGPTGV